MNGSATVVAAQPARAPAAAPFDLAAYRRRIRHPDPDGPLVPDAATLASLVAAHSAAIAFENLDALAGRVPSLDPAGLVAKLVRRQRGGWCFEQNTLLFHALRAIGFEVDRLEGCVRAGVPDDVETPRTHLALRVTLDDRPWLADVGFGALSPPSPLALDTVDAQVHGNERHRLLPRADGSGWTLQGATDGEWHDFYRLDARPVRAIDTVVANWYVATHPAAMLKNHLVVTRAVEGRRIALLDRRLTVRAGSDDPAPTRTFLQTPGEFADAFADLFGLRLSAADLDVAMAQVDRDAAPWEMSGLA